MKDIPWEALVGLLALLLTSLPQLTSRARLRRQMEFWAGQVQSTDIGYDRDVAEGFRRQASAKLLGVEAYPAYKFLFSLYVAFIGLLSAFSFGAELGAIYPGPVTSRTFSEQGLSGGVLEVSGAGFFIVSIILMATVVEFRRQVADKYLHAQVIERGRKKMLAENGRYVSEDVRKRLEPSAARVLGVIAFSVGNYVLVVNAVFVLRVGLDVVGDMTTLGTSVLLWSTVGAILLSVVAAPIVWELLFPSEPGWRHPIPLSDEAAGTRLSVSEPQVVIPDKAAVAEQVQWPWWHRLLCTRRCRQ